MSEKKNHIDSIFNSRLRHYSQEAPPDVWKNIVDELDLGRRKRRIIWFAGVAASIAVVMALSLTYLLIKNSMQRNLVTDRQHLQDTIMNKPNQTIPVYTEPNREEKEEPVQKEETEEKKVNMEERQTVKEENEFITEYRISGEKEKESDISGRPEEISGFRQPEFELAYLGMNYIMQLDYDIPSRERILRLSKKPESFPVIKERPSKGKDEDKYDENLLAEGDITKSNWAIGTQISPIYSYRNLGSGTAKVESNSIASNSYYNHSESGMVTYAGGVNINYLPFKRLTLQSGLYYSRLGVAVNNGYYFEGIAPTGNSAESINRFYSVSNSVGIVAMESSTSIDDKSGWFHYGTNTGDYGAISDLSVQLFKGEIIQNFDYLEVPVILRYRLIDRKIGFNLLGGLGTNFLVGSDAYYQEAGSREKIGKTTDIKTINYSSILGLGLDFAISDHLNVNLEPTFRYYLNSINESRLIRPHPYSMGVFTGITYLF